MSLKMFLILSDSRNIVLGHVILVVDFILVISNCERLTGLIS